MTLPSDPDFDLTNPHAHARNDDDEPHVLSQRNSPEPEPSMLDASCVRIVLIEPRMCQDCGDDIDTATGKNVGRTATHVVYFDLVGNGENLGIGEYCLFCAQEFAARLRASLPAEKPE